MFKFLVSLFILIIFLIFGFNNSGQVNLVILPNIMEIETRLYVVVFLFFLLGSFLCYFFYSYKILRFKWSDYRKSKKINRLEEELDKKNQEESNKKLLALDEED